jgi:hypothetical protein
MTPLARSLAPTGRVFAVRIPAATGNVGQNP